jgi:hypothetical protein
MRARVVVLVFPSRANEEGGRRKVEGGRAPYRIFCSFQYQTLVFPTEKEAKVKRESEKQ